MRGWLNEMPSEQLAAYLVGGIARAELPFEPKGLTGRTLAPQDFVLPPLPNQLCVRFTEEPSLNPAISDTLNTSIPVSLKMSATLSWHSLILVIISSFIFFDF